MLTEGSGPGPGAADSWAALPAGRGVCPGAGEPGRRPRLEEQGQQQCLVGGAAPKRTATLPAALPARCVCICWPVTWVDLPPEKRHAGVLTPDLRLWHGQKQGLCRLPSDREAPGLSPVPHDQCPHRRESWPQTHGEGCAEEPEQGHVLLGQGAWRTAGGQPALRHRGQTPAASLQGGESPLPPLRATSCVELSEGGRAGHSDTGSPAVFSTQSGSPRRPPSAPAGAGPPAPTGLSSLGVLPWRAGVRAVWIRLMWGDESKGAVALRTSRPSPGTCFSL